MSAWAAWLGGVAAVQAALAQAPDFSRYQVILDRKPFGDSASAVAAARAATTVVPTEAFTKNLRMCAITEDENGIRVGIFNVASNISYYFGLGETEDGITLLDADFEEEKALLQKGAEEYWISMSGETTVSSGGPTLFPGGPAAQGGPERKRESYAERLRRRREATRVKTVEVPQITNEELEQRLMNLQMELIRAQGEMGPPLPSPLTPEMDDQLVQEGYLEPAP
jgi:hypothetical protein